MHNTEKNIRQLFDRGRGVGQKIGRVEIASVKQARTIKRAKKYTICRDPAARRSIHVHIK